ncbi:MAG: Mur ligase family protein [Verrucomicrobiota bacterium]
MRFYFSGICGTAMGNGALLLNALRHEVAGSDSAVYPPMSDVLAAANIPVYDGFDADRIAKLQPDYVVVGNALSRGNPEIEYLLEQSEIKYLSLPELFREKILSHRRPIVIAGTHGKTTTSTIAAYLLDQNGNEPGWLIGGVPLDLSSGARLGEGKAFVIEGDEYDSAFFDKRSKFIHYRPQIATINNLEFDHADIFRDLEDVKRSFRHFLRLIPSSGHLLLNGDDPNVLDLLPADWTTVYKVGLDAGNDLVIKDFRDSEEGSSFSLSWKNELWAEVSWPLHGLFNARNAAMAALASALSATPSNPALFDLSPLAGFHGVRRRQDMLLKTEEAILLEDFAHHPTAVDAALESLRSAYPRRKLIACFEPRSNTAVRSVFQEEFTKALGRADSVYLGEVHRKAKMKEDQPLDTNLMVKELVSLGCCPAFAFESNQSLYEQLIKDLKGESAYLVVFFSNGSFDGIPHKVAAFLGS